MKQAVFALATAATIGVTALVTPSPAQAWRGGWGPGLAGGLIAGAVIGGVASGAYAYGPGYGYYGGPGYVYYGGPAYGYYWRLRSCLRPSRLLWSPVLRASVLSGLVIARRDACDASGLKGRRCLRPFLCRLGNSPRSRWRGAGRRTYPDMRRCLNGARSRPTAQS